MPANFFFCQNSSRRKFRFTILFLFLPLFFWGQSLTGLWTGALSNDSTTVRKDQLFEIVLTEYRGKVYGYSRSEFIVNDTLYYIVKRVKGTIEGDMCEVTDDDIIAYNFRGKLDKGIKVTSTFRRNGNDSAWYLAGTWKTNATKKYYSVTGKVDLGQEKDFTVSKIFPHLEELKIADEIAFYKERNESIPVAKIVRPQRVKTEYSFNDDPAPALTVASPDLERSDPEPVTPDIQKPANAPARTEAKDMGSSKPSITVTMPDLQRTDPEPIASDLKKPDNTLSRTKTKDMGSSKTSIDVAAPELQRTDPEPIITEVKKPENSLSRTETRNVAKTTIPSNTTQVAGKKPPVSEPMAKQDRPVASRNNTPVNTNDARNTIPVATAQKTNTIAATTPAAVPAVVAQKKSNEELTKNVATIAGRKSEFSQVVNFKSDSLLLSLYDNGEIDGDTVSVIMNGETIMAKQGLRASAIKKTIYIKPGQDEDFTLVLFADNLGKYPPNTGLLVVHDGDDTYHLRFSSDFQKSSGIVFRRKQ